MHSDWTRREDTARRRHPADTFVMDSLGRPMVVDREGRYRDARGPAPEPVVAEPRRPSEEDRRNFLSDTHCRRWVRDGIVAKDLDEAIRVVEAFGGRRDMPITREAVRSMPSSEQGFGIALTAIGESILSSRSDGFLDRLVAEIRSTVEEKGSFWRGWDYDGPGVFQKAGVRVQPEGDAWVVRISAVRSDPEPRLARELGLRQRFLRADHHVTFATAGDDYAIPMVQLERAARLAGATSIRPAVDVFADLTTPIGDSQYGFAVLHDDGRIRVGVSLDEVRVPAEWKYRHMARDAGLPSVPTEWTARLVEDDDGARIVGRALVWREWPDAWSSGIHLTVAAVDPADPEHEAEAVAASNRIAGLWAGLRGAYRDSDA